MKVEPLSKVGWFVSGFTCAVALLYFTGAAGLEAMPRAASVGGHAVAEVSRPVEQRDDGRLRIIAFGAHPDDCELRAGGVAAKWAALGHKVKFVSMTNGDIGHWRMAGGPLALRRQAEVFRCAKILGIAAQVIDIHDGELMVTMANRRIVCRLIREWQADIVITHRPNDYHPDHRYTGQLVQDAAYMVTVPYFCPLTPHLKRNPVFLYAEDRFQRPYPFQPDIVIAVDDVIDKKVEAVVALESQFYEGGCGGGPHLVPDPDDKAAVDRRKAAIRKYAYRRFASTADRFRNRLVELYGPELGGKIKYAEAFEICEYGRRPSKEEIRELFPFFPER